jgi:hypothetical protein
MVLTHGDNGDAAPKRETATSFYSALAKAYHWQEQLESGEYAGLEDLAAANGVELTNVGRVLRLTSLAPEIVERILNGDEPEGIAFADCRKTSGSRGRISLTLTLKRRSQVECLRDFGLRHRRELEVVLGC